MTKDELRKLLGKDTNFPDDDTLGDLPYLKLKTDNALLGWETGIYAAGSDELTEALNNTITEQVRSAVILALASLSIMVDEKGVNVYEQLNKDDVLVVPWKALLSDPDFNRDEEWRTEIVKAIEAASRYNEKKEGAA